MKLKGLSALVTGSTSGLGFEIAAKLIEEGAWTILCGRNKERLEEARIKMGKRYDIEYPEHIPCFTVDGQFRESVTSLMNKISPLISGRLDILVNNIGGALKFGGLEDLTDEDWFNTFDLNVMSAVRFTREALPLLKKSSHGGRIINISSFVALKPGRFNPDYAFCKAGIVNFTEFIARNYGKDGIRANVICPNTLLGDGLERNAEDRALRENISVGLAKEKIIESAKKKNPLGEIGELADVANTVAFLASDAGKFINGSCIPVDGGGLKGV